VLRAFLAALRDTHEEKGQPSSSWCEMGSQWWLKTWLYTAARREDLVHPSWYKHIYIPFDNHEDFARIKSYIILYLCEVTFLQNRAKRESFHRAEKSGPWSCLVLFTIHIMIYIIFIYSWNEVLFFNLMSQIFYKANKKKQAYDRSTIVWKIEYVTEQD
jgi:hypothetical protein